MDIQETEIEKIELRSTEVQEILTRPPKWIIRWGITIILFVVVEISSIFSLFYFTIYIIGDVYLKKSNT